VPVINVCNAKAARRDSRCRERPLRAEARVDQQPSSLDMADRIAARELCALLGSSVLIPLNYRLKIW
jgi:hypothetical protein